MNHFLLGFIANILVLLPLLLGSCPAQEEKISLYLEEGKSGAVWDVALSSDRKTLFSCGRDSTAKSWNIMTGECVRVYRPRNATLLTTLSLCPDNKTIACGDMNGRITIWETETGILQQDISAHSAYLLDVAYSSDGNHIVSVGRDDTIKIWDANTGRVLRSIYANSLWLNAVAITQDKSKLVTAGQDGSVKLWDFSSGRLISQLGSHSRFVRTICLSPDNSFIFSGGREGTVKVWDVKKQILVREFKVETGFPHHLALDISGKYVTVSMMNGLIEVWDWEKNDRIRKHEPQSYGSMVSVIDAKTNRLYSGHTDGSIRVWNQKDGALLVNMVGFSDGQWLTYTPDGYYDCSAYGDRYVQWIKGEDFYPLERYESLYKQPSIIEDALAGVYAPETGLSTLIDPPQVEILSPRNNQLFAFGSEPLEVIVEILARDRKKIENIVLALNGRSLSDANILESSILLKTDTILIRRFRIAVLPGINTIEALSYNAARVKSRAEQIRITVETQERLQPNLFILCVGIDQYNMNFPDLTYAALDAKRLAESLSNQEGKMYTRVYTQILTNKDATKQNILGAIDRFPSITSQDIVVLFFGGHGLRARDSRGKTKYYYVTSDATMKSIAKSGLAWDDFSKTLGKIKAGRIILFLDACHSGAVSAGASNEKVAASLARELGIIFASSSGNEFSYEDKSWGHGAFTKALLDGLNGGADYTRDNLVDWSELQLYVTTKVKELTRGSQNPMIPRLEEFANFNFVRIR